MTFVYEPDYMPVARSLLKLDLSEAQRYVFDIVQHKGMDADRLAEALKKQTSELIGASLELAHQSVQVLYMLASATANPLHRALGLRALGNLFCIGRYRHQEAIEYYDRATEIYQSYGQPVDAASAQVGKLGALVWMNRIEEAHALYADISQVLETHGKWFELADTKVNLANGEERQGNDLAALQLLDEARAIYQQLGDGLEYRLALAETENNRAIPLINLGRFEDAEQSIEQAHNILVACGQSIEATRPLINRAIMRIVQGRVNEALALRERVRAAHLNDTLAAERAADALLAELEISDALLTIRRFADVQALCHQARPTFQEREMRMEEALTLLNEGIAYAGLANYPLALASLQEARALFAAMSNPIQVANTDLEIAMVACYQGKYAYSLQVGQECILLFQAHNLPIREAQAQIIAARSALELGAFAEAEMYLGQALALGGSIPSLAYQTHSLYGALAARRNQPDQAIKAYHTAITFLEQLRNYLMVEFRAGFLEDKQVLYENMVDLYLAQNEPVRALEYVERARSRALLDMLAHRLDVRIRPRLPEDIALVQQLESLLAERNHWYCRLSSMERKYQNDKHERGIDEYLPGIHDANCQNAQQQIAHLEAQITSLREELLIRNADYAHDATLWQVQTASIEELQQHLDPHTLLVEYFTCQNQLIVFLVTHNQVRAQRLPCDLNDIMRTLRLLDKNRQDGLKAQNQRDMLTHKARVRLKQLYDWLLAPCADIVAHYPQIRIVPHGVLHYLPFHALYDGSAYLIERHEVSYLPAASIMPYCAAPQPSAAGMVSFGHSWHGHVPQAVQEALDIAQRWKGTAFVEQAASLEQIRTSAQTCRILHFAAHANYNQQNPLFSGLHLDDGQLTTLDTFNLKLSASLVTLSACETGRHVIGGGDELLGLTRAFLYAGASSLVLSLWKVEDQSALRFMNHFYDCLQQGDTKGAALRRAQLELLHSDEHAHLHFWAPFILVGHAGTLE